MSALLLHTCIARAPFIQVNHQTTNSMKDIDWANLPFGYMPTDYNVRCYYRNGEWGEIEVSSSETINLHMAATCLHYGQEAFEGQKAFRCPDGKIRAFRLTRQCRTHAEHLPRHSDARTPDREVCGNGASRGETQ